MKPVQPSKQKIAYKIGHISINSDSSKHAQNINGTVVYSPYALYEGQKMFIQYVLQCLKTKQNGLIQSPTGTGKTLSLLCSSLSWCFSQQQQHPQKCAAPPRIIYTSRTHAQLKQIIQEVTKTGFDLKVAVLGSRDQTCINDDLKELVGQSKELECRLRVMRKFGKFCQFFHHEEHYIKMNSFAKIADIQQIKYTGKTQGYCPFFYQKHSKNVANLILMPYNYLLDDRISKSQDISQLLHNSIIIIDEAHNMPSVCENSKEYSISVGVLSRALQQIGDLREQKLRQQQKTPIPKKTQSSSCSPAQSQQNQLKSSLQQLQLHASYIYSIHSHINSLNIPLENGLVMGAPEFLDGLDSATKGAEFGSISAKVHQLVEACGVIGVDILLKPFWGVQAWFGFLGRLAEMFRLRAQQLQKLGCYKIQICYSGSDIKVNILCLDPKPGFEQLTRMNPHSIILTSGTLSPLNSMPMQLQTKFQTPLSCPHIIKKQQISGCILTKGPKGHKLTFSYQNRDNATLYQELGTILLEIVSNTKNGVVVFLPSYAVMEKVKIELTNSGTMTKLYTVKRVFFEKQGSVEFKAVMDEYLQEAAKAKGAVLFALARGKISEGFDFSGEKCRAVVLVGVPYPAAKDLKVTLKMQYLDSKNISKSSEQQKSMTGNQWYICSTIRCINQSIGRIVRNQQDYGSIYLIDERFRKNQILSQISSWARDCLKIVDDFQEFKLHLELFQHYFSKKETEAEEVELFFTSHLGTKLTNKFPPPKLPQKPSAPPTLPQSQPCNKSIDPQTQLLSLKSEFQKAKKSTDQPMKQQKPSLQKLIFGRNKKTLAVDTVRECPICRLDRILIKNTQCIHEICEQCWDIWLKKDLRCPVCRVRVREKYLIKPL